MVGLRVVGANKVKFPKIDSLQKCLQIATTFAAAENLLRNGQQVGAKDGEDSEKIITILDNNAKNRQLIENKSTDSYWAGHTAPTDFELIQDQSLDSALDYLLSGEESMDNMLLDIAISDDSKILRGYSVNNEEMSPQGMAAMDKLLNRWLAENDLINEMTDNDAVIYEATREGSVVKEKGKAKRADVEKLKALLIDEKKGFANYVQEHNDEIKLEIHQHAYPDEKPEPTETSGISN